MNATPPVAVEGGPIWIDLGTHDLDGAIEFYTALLGWEFGEGSAEFGGYRMILKDGLPIGGAMTTLMGPEGPTTEPQAPTTWCVYLRTADIEQTVARAVEAGAQIMVPSMPIADLGTMAIIVDPAGAVVGLWQPDTTATGTPARGEASAGAGQLQLSRPAFSFSSSTRPADSASRAVFSGDSAAQVVVASSISSMRAGSALMSRSPPAAKKRTAR